MDIIKSANSTHKKISDWKQQQFKIAFVPTMGNLHAGHLGLIEKAQNVADKVVVSIYVNPMQFSPGEDFDSYPRSFENDCEKLTNAGVDLLFLPTSETMYQTSIKKTTQVYVPEISGILCGEHRPDHFLGVTTIVSKLFNIVQPDVAIFGQKDFQQVSIIRRMVADLFMPIKIIALETKRENDGLAMSSRNQYLDEAQRKTATNINKVMIEMSKLLIDGGEITAIETKGIKALKSYGFIPEYFSFRDPDSLSPLTQIQAKIVLLVAVKLGETRLIDNHLFSLRNTV